MSPLWRGGDMLVDLCPHSLSTQFVSVRSLRLFVPFHRAGGQTGYIDPILGWCWPTFYDTDPSLAQYWVIVSCLAPRWMWSGVTDGGPTLTQLWFNATCWYRQQEVLTRAEWILPAPATLAQHLTDIGSVSACTCVSAFTHHRQQKALSSVEWLMARAGKSGPALNRHWVDVSYLLVVGGLAAAWCRFT